MTKQSIRLEILKEQCEMVEKEIKILFHKFAPEELIKQKKVQRLKILDAIDKLEAEINA